MQVLIKNKIMYSYEERINRLMEDLKILKRQAEWMLLPIGKQIKIITAEIQELRKDIHRYKNEMVTDQKSDWIYEILVDKSVEEQRSLEKFLATLKWREGNKISEDVDISIIKSIPMSEILQLNKFGKASCLWHSPDKHPSMSYNKKTNRVKCFSCGEGGDVIDVVMKLNECDFKSALKILIKK